MRSTPERIFTGSPKGASMEKWLCWGSLGVAGILLLLFLVDMFMEIPFGGAGYIVDGIGVVSCGLVAYLAWDSSTEQQ